MNFSMKDFGFAKRPFLELAIANICLIFGGALLPYSFTSLLFFISPPFFIMFGIILNVRVTNNFERTFEIHRNHINEAKTDLHNTMIEVAKAKRKLEDTTRETEKTIKELEKTKKRVFSFISNTNFHSIEDQLSEVKKTLGMSNLSHSFRTSILERIKKLEKKLGL